MSRTVGRPNLVDVFLAGSALSVRASPKHSPDVLLDVGEDALDERVGFRVHRRAVERIVALVDAQEAGGKLEGLLAEARHLRSARRLRKAPCRSRCATMFAASVGLSPETRVSSGTEAVLTSTPTAFTQSSTTASSARASCVWLTSCWYWPTPIDLGSILTSSASGSCRRRAIETAPRRLTSTSGNSREAYSEAE
jgi:hypothetical protein